MCAAWVPSHLPFCHACVAVSLVPTHLHAGLPCHTLLCCPVKQEVESLESLLREVEIASMAKVRQHHGRAMRAPCLPAPPAVARALPKPHTATHSTRPHAKTLSPPLGLDPCCLIPPALPALWPPPRSPQVWAYPDDLAAIMQGIRTQEQRHGARVVSACRAPWAAVPASAAMQCVSVLQGARPKLCVILPSHARFTLACRHVHPAVACQPPARPLHAPPAGQPARHGGHGMRRIGAAQRQRHRRL